ncbi:MAG: hypothetical protein AAF755_08075 [Pseudomonadota bacterium]
MLSLFLALLAGGLGLGETPDVAQAAAPKSEAAASAAPVTPQPQSETAQAPAAPPSPSVSIGSGVVVGQNTLMAGVPATPSAPVAAPAPPTPAPAPAPTAPAASAARAVPGMNMAVVPAGLVAEAQTPSGKFTTATEIKPIMSATKGNWVSVREFEGQDLLYVTSIWSWRCGLAAMAISVNNEPMQNWPLPPCHMQFAAPNAILPDDGSPFLRLRLGSVQSVSIQIVYDDLSMDAMTYQRRDILTP